MMLLRNLGFSNFHHIFKNVNQLPSQKLLFTYFKKCIFKNNNSKDLDPDHLSSNFANEEELHKLLNARLWWTYQ